MIYYPNDKLDFGKYHGVQAGLVYLLAPGYIQWAIRENSSFCLGEVDFLSSLDVIDSLGKGSWVAHEAEADVQIIKNNYADQVDFEKLKFSGYKPFQLPDDMLEINEKKLKRFGKTKIRSKIVPRDERYIFIFYPGELLFSKKIELKQPHILSEEEDGAILGFTVDNTNGIIGFLPHVENLKVSSYWLSDWDLEEQDIQYHIEESKPLIGSIENGLLMLKK